MKARDVAMIVVVAAIFVGAVGVLIAAVATHEEPGFTNPHVRWSSLPLYVSCATYGGGGEGCETVTAAVDVTNRRLGFEALVYHDGADRRSDIVVVMNAPVEVGRDAPGGDYRLSTRPAEGDGPSSARSVYDGCDVRVMAVGGAGDLPLLTVQHELGHCLGLAHDDYARSIMYDQRRPTPDGVLPPWISDHDREILRARYAP